MDFDELKGVTAFVIDDNPNNLNVIKDHLVHYGLNPIPLKSGEVALNLITRVVPEIILLDIQMPGGIDGFETCRRLKRIDNVKDIPVIFISALSDTFNKVEGFKLGGVDYISKPVEIQELLSRIYVHITISRLQSKLHQSNTELEKIVEQRTASLKDVNAKLNQEISDHIEAENKLTDLKAYLTEIINSMDAIVIGINKDLEITLWNQVCIELTDVSENEAIGKDLASVFPQILSDLDLIKSSLETRESNNRRKKVINTDDTISYFDIFIYPMKKNDAVIRIEEVTNRVLMEEMIVQNEKMISIGGLAAGMAHEINNPLAGIIQTTKVLLNRFESNQKNTSAANELGLTMEDLQKYMHKRDIFKMLNNISSSGERLSEIVNNMLSFVHKGGAQIEKHSLVEIVENCIELASLDYDMKKKYDFKQISIVRKYDTDLPLIECEKAKIQQVILNILHNGAQAMHQIDVKKPSFIIKIFTNHSNDSVQIEIQDNGPGIEEEVERRVFEPFFTTKPPGLGTGLGLSVSYFIITEEHNGTLRVENKKGSGANFIINLPITRDVYNRLSE